MIVSTKGRYALRVLIDIAENSNGEYIAMKEVAARQEISLKYLERILPTLVKEGMIEGIQGKGGGYRLTRAPEDYNVADILRATEGDLAPVACLECGADVCPRKENCRTLPMWIEFDKTINEYFSQYTIADLMKK